MFSEEQFSHRLTLMKDFFEARDYSQAFRLAYSLKQELVKEPPVDPGQLGWVRVYGFKSLCALQKYQEAFDYLSAKESHMYIIPATEAAPLYLKAAELVVRLERSPQEVVSWGQKALDLKLAADDLPGAVDACNTICTFLGLLDHDRLNAKYAERLIDMGIEYKAERLIIGGVAHLLRNPTLASHSELRDRFMARRTEFELAFNGQFKSEATGIYRDYLVFCAGFGNKAA